MNDLLKSHSCFWWLSRCNPVGDSPVTYPNLPTPLSERLSDAVARYVYISAGVVALLFWSSPSAVAGVVIPIDIYTIKSHVVGLNAHIGKEVFKREPSFANLYSPPTILRPLDLLWVSASLDHATPTFVSRGLTHSVCDFGCKSGFCLKTPAGLCVPGVEERSADCCFVTAIANADPSCPPVLHLDAPNLPDSDEPSESQTPHIGGYVVEVLGASTRHRMPRSEVGGGDNSIVSTGADTVPSSLCRHRFSLIHNSQLSENLTIERHEFRHVYSPCNTQIINEVVNV